MNIRVRPLQKFQCKHPFHPVYLLRGTSRWIKSRVTWY